MILYLLLVGLGGALGSILRYLLAIGLSKLWSAPFPLGTFLANVIGCFAIGNLGSILTGPTALRDEYRLFLIVGLLGGFTTFSSYAWETIGLGASQDFLRAASYVLLSNGLGLIAVFAGMKICGRL